MNFAIDLLVGFLELVSVALILKFIEIIILLLINRKKYSINGFWISEYHSAFDSEICAYDIVEIHSMGNRLIITYQQYHNKLNGINIFQGEGYMSSNGCVAISYFLDNKTARHVGSMVLAQIDLKCDQKALKGKFFEYDSRDGIKPHMEDKMNVLKLYDIDYCLIKCDLKPNQKIKFYFKKPVFKSYSEVKSKYEVIHYDLSL